MINPTKLPVEEKLTAAANAVYISSEFSDDLWNQISNQNAPVSVKPVRFSFLHSRPLQIAGLSLVILALIFLAIGPQRVLAAFNQFIGYIPGIGFFRNDNSTLYLAQPVTSEQDGVTLTVQQTVADKDRLVITYTINGLAPFQQTDAASCLYDSIQVRLPDGKMKRVIGGGSSADMDTLKANVEFPPLPEKVNKITLVVSSMSPDPACTAPEDWAVNLKLGPAPANMQLADVNEFPQPDASTSGTGTTSTEQPVVSPQVGEIEFTIDRTVALDDGYVISGHPTWKDQEWQSVVPEIAKVQLTDADGRSVAFNPTDDVMKENSFAIKTVGKDFKLPLHITIPSVVVTGYPADPSSSSFSFDAGASPQMGQKWEINKELKTVGQTIKIQSVQAVTDIIQTGPDPSQPGKEESGFVINETHGPSILGLVLRMSDPQTTQHEDGELMMNSESGPDGELNSTNKLFYEDHLPTGNITIQILNILFRVEGPWQLDIEP
jgi:hypothetical protein